MTEMPIEDLLVSPGDLDTALPVSDITSDTLIALSDRLERSTVARHFLFREAEMDDLWRTAEVTLFRARIAGEDPAVLGLLENLLSVALRAHDLAGEGRIAEAAATLRSTASNSERSNERRDKSDLQPFNDPPIGAR